MDLPNLSSETSRQEIHNIQKSPIDLNISRKDLLSRIYNSLSVNPYFSAGAGLVGIGVVGTLSKRFLIIASALFRRRFLSTLEIDNQDRYRILLQIIFLEILVIFYIEL